jgi:hypothetical protein
LHNHTILNLEHLESRLVPSNDHFWTGAAGTTNFYTPGNWDQVANNLGFERYFFGDANHTSQRDCVITNPNLETIMGDFYTESGWANHTLIVGGAGSTNIVIGQPGGVGSMLVHQYGNIQLDNNSRACFGIYVWKGGNFTHTAGSASILVTGTMQIYSAGTNPGNLGVDVIVGKDAYSFSYSSTVFFGVDSNRVLNSPIVMTNGAAWYTNSSQDGTKLGIIEFTQYCNYAIQCNLGNQSLITNRGQVIVDSRSGLGGSVSIDTRIVQPADTNSYQQQNQKFYIGYGSYVSVYDLGVNTGGAVEIDAGWAILNAGSSLLVNTKFNIVGGMCLFTSPAFTGHTETQSYEHQIIGNFEVGSAGKVYTAVTTISNPWSYQYGQYYDTVTVTGDADLAAGNIYMHLSSGLDGANPKGQDNWSVGGQLNAGATINLTILGMMFPGITFNIGHYGTETGLFSIVDSRGISFSQGTANHIYSITSA